MCVYCCFKNLSGEHARLCSQCVHHRDSGAVEGTGSQVHRRRAGVLSAVVGHGGHGRPKETSEGPSHPE